MTAYEAARKWGMHATQITKWCKSGRIEAVKVKVGNKLKWIIPDDYPMPTVQTNGLPSEARQKAVLRRYGKRGYIARYAGAFSIRHMAKFLETTTADVRATYDDIVAKGGF